MRRGFRSFVPAFKPAVLAVLIFSSAIAAADDEPVRLAPIVVTPTRVEQSSFDLPVSIDAFTQEQIRQGEPQVNLSETISHAPGVVANTRQNYAQDLQVSIRGFGARSTFGIRGVRLYADGIPLTMPDGQGQAANIDLSSARQIEVMRGPFSALYGNSSGGVISVFTEDGPQDFTMTGSAWAGSFDSSRIGLKLGGQEGALNYIFDVSRFDTEGFRDHSAATRDTVNGKVRLNIGDDTSVTLVANYLNQPETQDPLGLDKNQLQQNREQAGTNAEAQNTRKSIENSQGGAILEHRFSGEDSIRLLGYSGTRTVQQFLAIGPRGVVDLNRDFEGVDGRWTHKMDLVGRPLTFTLGFNYDNMQEARKAFNNDAGNIGALVRDELDTVYNVDEYAQAEWAIAERWVLSAGLRHTSVRFKSEDHFITGANGDDSGKLDFSDTTPVGGIVFKVTPTFNLYANAGKGFETPTFAELAYRSTNALVNGFNFDLQPAESTNYEVGAKAYVGSNTRVNAAVFRTDTKNEIVVFSNSGGRSVYQNVDNTTRKGIELEVDSDLGRGFNALLSYTYLDATFDNSFGTCVGFCPSVTGPNATVPAGNKIPGIPANMVYGELGWKYAPLGLATALEARWNDKVYTNDLNDEAASAYAVLNWRLSLEQKFGALSLTEFGRIDNIFDKEYVGSVIVNESNRRYYEPAPGTNYTIGVTASYKF
ncbi:MAG TPA: TonB-dependent receptor [Burkholderiales bacterium]|nr:TonB-dependent receptor [Burkholderiales bacterium]